MFVGKNTHDESGRTLRDIIIYILQNVNQHAADVNGYDYHICVSVSVFTRQRKFKTSHTSRAHDVVILTHRIVIGKTSWLLSDIFADKADL